MVWVSRLRKWSRQAESEDLGLGFQAAERPGVDDAVAIALDVEFGRGARAGVAAPRLPSTGKRKGRAWPAVLLRNLDVELYGRLADRGSRDGRSGLTAYVLGRFGGGDAAGQRDWWARHLETMTVGLSIRGRSSSHPAPRGHSRSRYRPA